jgi:hypothetical protein
VGAWGPGIFENDTSCDVRDAFIDLIQEGCSPEDATVQLITRWGEPRFDPDDEPLFWLGLAAAQVRTGRLVASVRDQTVAFIDRGGDVDNFFEEDDLRGARESALRGLRTELLGPQHGPTSFAVRKHANSWPVGSILAFALDSGRKSLWRVVDHHVGEGGRFAIVEVLRGTYIRLPSELRLALTSSQREKRTGRYLRIVLLAKHERLSRLEFTGRGRSVSPTALRSVWGGGRRQGRECYTVVPSTQSLEDLLAEVLA